MKKVLQVLSCLVFGGTEAYVMEHYRKLPQDIHCDFAVFLPVDGPYVEEIKRNGGRVFVIGTPSVRSCFRFYKNIKRLMEENGPYDLMHCHVNEGNAIPLLCGAALGIRKRIAHSHAINNCPTGFAAKAVYYLRKSMIRLFATDYYACSSMAGESLFGKRFFERKGEICKNGIDVKKFIEVSREETEQLRKAFQIRENAELVVGNISRFDRNKNQSFALDVFRELLKRYPHAVLLLGGNDGGELENIKQKIAHMGIENRVRLIGVRQDVPACLKLIDVYLFPSKQEGLGIAALEAQAAGCLCVTSTAVPAQTNMGVGNNLRISLEEHESVWANRIIQAVDERKTVTPERIVMAFCEKGYEITRSADRLVELYEK